MNKYYKWIEKYQEENEYLYGKCKEATLKMISAFPDLTKVAGHVYTERGKAAHYWCQTKDGTILDPTAAQFQCIFEYEKWKPETETIVGKCMYCGKEIWEKINSLEDNSYYKEFCNKHCEQSFADSL